MITQITQLSLKKREKTRDDQEEQYVSKAPRPADDDATGKCPKCGALNDPNALFCENCGNALRKCVCPSCYSPVEPGTDFCEACHSYMSKDLCSFCGAPLADTDTFCPTCSCNREGEVCPICKAPSIFPFCQSCGSPITDQAREQARVSWDVPFIHQVQDLENELENLWLRMPVNNESQRSRRERNLLIRSKVMSLLEKDGEILYEKLRESEPLINEAQLEDLKEQKRRQLQLLLDQMAIPEQPTPAQARLLCMASRPKVSRLAWRCNFKNVLHTSPLGCACPQKGGKWVVLTSDNVKIQNDK
ncbi:MAG: zinc ribbon domain-containing protein [Bacteroidaceae bacterium]|nr:zinc ribbon domain-containing protein [Bacteroidaceae bacterium]